MSVEISACSACGHRVFPARLWCPACGHDRAHGAPAHEAEIQAWTEISGQDSERLVIATVRALPDGPVLVVRLDAAPAQIGQRVDLADHGKAGQPLPWGRIRSA